MRTSTRLLAIAIAIVLSGCGSRRPVAGPDVPERVYREIHQEGAYNALQLLREGMRERGVYGVTEPYIPIRKTDDVRKIWVPDHEDPVTGRLVHGHWESTVIEEGSWYID